MRVAQFVFQSLHSFFMCAGLHGGFNVPQSIRLMYEIN